ncbi:carboxy-terminal processing protease [Asaia bogorensis NBRC 16594]|uniref:Peptidase S41 n=2 Tax=Asaia bogorensis TaxID=91915 RepID=A0AAN4U2V6_9PROT|nr:carboxy-terminal processing protease [Asaia bogorensis NBRC 16594]GEL53758.1 peptidase S41 [Asaia bogorensis NBRC 16594]
MGAMGLAVAVATLSGAMLAGITPAQAARSGARRPQPAELAQAGPPAAVTPTRATQQPEGGQGGATLDTGLLSSVLSSAFRFLTPRTLDAHSSRTYSLWGLDGLTAIDPSITIEEPTHGPKEAASLRLSLSQKTVAEFREPGENETGEWVRVLVSIMDAAWRASPALRSAGRDALLQSFFDELFNHLDPYSRYVAPAPAGNDRANRTGDVAGVGLSLQRDGTGLVIGAINANGPAWAAGANIGQKLLAVDGHSTRNQDAATVEGWLNGAPGSKVRLLLADPGHHGAIMRLERQIVPPQTVFASGHDHIAVMRIASFSSDTAEELSQNIDQALQDKKLVGLIIDLRGDRGGVLQQAVTATALVLDQGIAVVTKGRDPKSNHIWAVQGGDMTHGLPITVLVDGRTASAAEIMAAALSDHRRAVVIGSATLGKGLVQAIGQMPDGGELFVTWSRVIAPLGWPLQGLGVTPQICTSRGALSLEQQLSALGQGKLLDAETVRASREIRFPVSVSRILDIRRHCPAALGTDADLDTAAMLLHRPDSYRAALAAMPDDMDDASP